LIECSVRCGRYSKCRLGHTTELAFPQTLVPHSGTVSSCFRSIQFFQIVKIERYSNTNHFAQQSLSYIHENDHTVYWSIFLDNKLKIEGSNTSEKTKIIIKTVNKVHPS